MNFEKFIPIDRAATRLGLPGNWLKAEAQAGRVPSLRIGNRTLVDLDTVRRALLERAASAPQPAGVS
jgi:hypothetical protein